MRNSTLSRLPWLLLFTALLLCGGGCAPTERPTPEFKRETDPRFHAVTLPTFVKDAPEAHQAMTLKVPLILQKDNYSSGPSSLAMVMGYYDARPYAKKEVWKRSGTTFRQVLKECGNDMDGLERAARSYGFTRMNYEENASLGRIRELLDHGIAPIANVQSFHSTRENAYCSVVIAGYTPTELLLHDPTKGIYKIAQEEFLKHWRAHLCTPSKGLAVHSLFILHPRQ
jgi:predicted double-glycine peptidase